MRGNNFWFQECETEKSSFVVRFRLELIKKEKSLHRSQRHEDSMTLFVFFNNPGNVPSSLSITAFCAELLTAHI